MARAAIPGRLTWRVATVTRTRDETATARTLVLDVPGWPGHLAGQHVDVKLTAPDGYSAQRPYSIASPPDTGLLELTVQRIDDGEVSPYLTDVAAPGDQFELRGPIGGWFAWRPETAAPLLLVAGGSGVVPLMAMIRANAALPDDKRVPARLIYSVRRPADVIYAAEISERIMATPLDVTYCYSREAPPGARLGRIAADVIPGPADPAPEVFVCGPTGFVEVASSLLLAAGHSRPVIKTERFGPTS